MRDADTGIDLIALYAKSDAAKWNEMLADLYMHDDITGAMNLMRRLQIGMNDAAKMKLNTETLCNWYLRLQSSLENTMRQIYRKKYPNPLYNSLNKNKLGSDFDKHLSAKRSIDQEFRRQIKKHSY